MFLNDIKYNWIGDIPKDWEVKRIKNLFYLKKEVSENPEQEQVLSLTMNGIIKRDVSSNEGQLPDTYKGYTKIYPDDIVMNPMDLKSGWIDRSKYDGIISPSYYVLNKLNDDLEIQFFNYQLQRHYKERIFFSFGQGVSYDYRWGLGRETILNFPIVVPPLEIQTQIVSFLDTKTQKIDELIEKTEQKIKLLKEKRTSLINHCVTKGLNPDVGMKDSGVEWIGEIPSHWVVSKFKYLSDIVTGNTPSKTDEELYYTDSEDGFLWVKPTSLDKGLDYVNESEEHLTYEGRNLTRVIPKDSTMICCIGNTIGKHSISGQELSTNQQINSVIPNQEKLHPWFCLFYVNVFTRDLLKWSNFVTLPIYTKTDLEDTFFILPPYEEQTQIVEKLIHENHITESTIEKETQRIELLKEYRQSLISEVITGKIDVRDWNG